MFTSGTAGGVVPETGLLVGTGLVPRVAVGGKDDDSFSERYEGRLQLTREYKNQADQHDSDPEFAHGTPPDHLADLDDWISKTSKGILQFISN